MADTLNQDTVQLSSLTFAKKDDNPQKVLAGQQQQQHRSSGGNKGTSACIDPAAQDAKNMRSLLHFLGSGAVVKDTAEYIRFYKAVCVGDWSTGKHILDSDPALLTTPICSWQMTVIQMAAASTDSASFLRKLIDYMRERGVSLRATSLRATDDVKPSALHYAARSGNIEMAKLLVEKDPTLAQEVDKNGLTPLEVAARRSQTSVVRYLMALTLRECPNLSNGPAGASLLRHLILDGLYENAIELLESNPKLALEREDRWGETALWVLSTRPAEFPSGSRLAYWQRPLYQVYNWISECRDISRGDVENQFLCSKSVRDSLISLRIFHNAHKRKSKHSKVFQLLKSLIEKTLDCTDLRTVNTLLGLPTLEAARNGIHEFVEQVIRAYPLVVAATDNLGRTLFFYAVMHRQHEVFNLLFQLGLRKGQTIGLDNSQNTILHHAANWSTHARCRIENIPGAALQMQRELQWYKEVEEVIQPSFRVRWNANKVADNVVERKRPREIFTESHKELVKEGSEWMKGTANSYTIVAALVVTIAFAAAFTVPGGTNGDTGAPIFLLEISFMVFTISNMLAFFSSATSLLMFLGILTSRYSQEDFLRALPLKLSIGLISLFFSITSMLVAFTAGIHVMVSKHVPWIAIPAGLLACVSATLFGFLQAPLLVEVVYSTFGPSIFRS